MTGPLLRVADLDVTFRTERGPVRAVRGVSFEVNRGEVLAIVGESGSGKTVTMLSLLGLIDPREAAVTGTVAFEGRDILPLADSELRRLRGRHIALISQDTMTALTPVYTIGWQIAEQIRAHDAVSSRAARRRTVELLGEVGLPDPSAIADRYPHELSGGQRQRAVIAMALSCNPALLVADEPTTALDVTVQAQVLELLARLRRDFGSSIILVTHSMGVVAEIADRVAVMYAGQVVESGTTSRIFGAPQHPYTWGLLASIPPLTGERPERLTSIPGSPPNPARFPPGCGFAPRCRFATQPCATPPMLTGEGTDLVRCIVPVEVRPALRREILPRLEPAA